MRDIDVNRARMQELGADEIVALDGLYKRAIEVLEFYGTPDIGKHASSGIFVALSAAYIAGKDEGIKQMQYTTEQLRKWANQGQAISPLVVIDLLDQLKTYETLLATSKSRPEPIDIAKCQCGKRATKRCNGMEGCAELLCDEHTHGHPSGEWYK